MGLDNVGAQTERDLPIWNGLIRVHAQERVQRAWAKWGFEMYCIGVRRTAPLTTSHNYLH
jgi:hypothetical protein